VQEGQQADKNPDQEIFDYIHGKPLRRSQSIIHSKNKKCNWLNKKAELTPGLARDRAATWRLIMN